MSIGKHHSKSAGTVEWLTPPSIIASLGPFDLDPCAPIVQPYPTAQRTYTILHDGLAQPWDGRVWLNPPYADGVIEHWLARLADHGNGTALIFSRTETDAFVRHVWHRATALLFMYGRIHFHVGEAYSVLRTRKTFWAGDRASGNAGAPTVLCAYGMDDADVLAACDIDGQFVPLRIPRSVVVSWMQHAGSWAQELRTFMAARRGPVSLPELYLAFASHPKAKRNAHYKAKLRQQLQSGPYRNVQPGLWENVA